VTWVDWLAIGLSIITGILAIAAIVSYHYVRRVAGDGIQRSLMLRRIVYRNRRVALGGSIIGLLIAYTLLRLSVPQWNLPAIQPPWTSILIAVSVDLMLWGPIADAISFYRIRRDGLPHGDVPTDVEGHIR
jgi:hypothetical protein